MRQPRISSPRRQLGIAAVALLIASLGTATQAAPPLASPANASVRAAYATVNNDPRFIQTYVNNIENLETVDANCPGDWQDLIYYMKTYETSPDLFLVQQVSPQDLNTLVNFMTNNLHGIYQGLIAVPNPEQMNSPCGAEKAYQSNAIIYRVGRFDVVSTATWQSDAQTSTGSCANNHQDRTINLRARMFDKIANKYITAASIHWPTGNSDGPPCAVENAREAATNMAATGGDLRIWGGDANLGHQTSGDWRTWYSRTNGDLGGTHGYRDVAYDDCKERHSTKSGILSCLSGTHWTVGGDRRIDFLFAKKGNGGMPFVGAEHTVTFDEGDQADLTVTGTDRQDRSYSDHRAVRARIHY